MVALQLLAVGVVVVALGPNSSGLPERLARDLSGFTPRVAPELAGLPPDPAGPRENPPALGLDLERADELLLQARGSLVSVRMSPQYEAGLYVLDTEGRTLDSTGVSMRMFGDVPAQSPPSAGEPFDLRRAPGLQPLVDAALAGEENPDRLHARAPDGRVLAAAPVMSENGRVVGAVVATLRLPGASDLLRLLIDPNTLILVGVVSLLALAPGFLTAWYLTRRLGQLARATEYWGRGDFAATVDDSSRDELGRLGRKLNGMAAQLDDLVRTRGDLAALEARNRFARDLHDSVKQQVFATSLQVDTAHALSGDGPEAERLAGIRDSLGRLKKELNALIRELRPADLQNKTLPEAFQDYATGWSPPDRHPGRGPHLGRWRNVLRNPASPVPRRPGGAGERRPAQRRLEGRGGSRPRRKLPRPPRFRRRLWLRPGADKRRRLRPAEHARAAGRARRACRGSECAGGGDGRLRRLPAGRRRCVVEGPITVLIVDDHALIREWGRAYLETQPGITVVGEAGSGEAAVRVAAEHAPDVALMDLIMPGGIDGVEATRRLKAVSPNTKVVVLTSYHDDEHVFPAIRAGAFSYVLKDVEPREIAAAVRKAAAGEAVLHPRVAARVMRELHGPGPDEPGFVGDLSGRELEVLRLVAEGLSNAEISERLYISEKTVKRHVSNILSKLHLADRTQAAVYAWREGVVRRE